MFGTKNGKIGKSLNSALSSIDTTRKQLLLLSKDSKNLSAQDLCKEMLKTISPPQGELYKAQLTLTAVIMIERDIANRIEELKDRLDV